MVMSPRSGGADEGEIKLRHSPSQTSTFPVGNMVLSKGTFSFSLLFIALISRFGAKSRFSIASKHLRR